MSQLPRTRVRPSPNKAKSPRRRPCLALDSDDEARYIVTVRSAKVRCSVAAVAVGMS